MSPSKILFFLCIFFVVGIFLESIIKIPQVLLWAFLLIGVLTIVLSAFGKKNKFTIIGFCFLFLVLGILRMQISEFNIANDKLSKFNGAGTLTLQGEISGEPDVRDNFQKLKIKIADSIILATTGRYPEYNYLDKVKITGKLEAPAEYDDFNYKNYLMKDGIYSVINFPKIEKLDRGRASIQASIYSGILWIKQKIRESIRKNFSPPQSSILEGTILGDNGVMSQDLKNKLNITGLRHIIAVSGTHVVILSSIIMSLLLAFGFWRGQAFYLAVIFICLYIILTGLPASGIRAGIMGGIYLLAQKLGKQSAISRIIVLACSLMLLFNPLLLFYDVGFQLSFLAVFGIIYFEPLIRNFFKFLIKKFSGLNIKEKHENSLSLISVTLAAQIFTLPIIVFNFGNISWVSPIANILVLPIIYYLMLFGFLASLAGIFSNILGWLLSIPCYILLNYFIWVIDFFSKPWMYQAVKNVSWIWLVNSYLIISFITSFLNKKYSQRF